MLCLACVQTAAVSAKVGDAMAKASEAMAAIGKTNDPAKIAATMQQFQKETAKMDMGQEMIDDTLDEAFDDEETEAETSELMNQACTSSASQQGIVICVRELYSGTAYAASSSSLRVCLYSSSV
jgi:1-aminocyclopropane-1-carboxylate deaminase/D-cysteine desulfhydrase-like pyridoxal-dependent ACC family enzyme